MLYISRHDVIGDLGESNPSQTLRLVLMSVLMGSTPDVVMGAAGRIAKGVDGHAEAVVAGMIEAAAGSNRDGALAVGELVLVLINTHDVAFHRDDAVIDGHQPLAIVRTVGLERRDGEHAVGELAVHVEAVALRIGKQTLPVVVGMTLILRAEVTLLLCIEEVHLHLRRGLPAGGVVVDVAITLVGDLDDVDAILQRIGAGGKHRRTEVAHLQSHRLLTDALHHHDDAFVLVEGDAGGILVIIIEVAVLQLALQVGERTEGRELADAELCGIGAGKHCLRHVANLGNGNLLYLLSRDALAQLRAEVIGEVGVQKVLHEVVLRVELHLRTAGKTVGTTLHNEADRLHVVNTVVAEGDA